MYKYNDKRFDNGTISLPINGIADNKLVITVANIKIYIIKYLRY